MGYELKLTLPDGTIFNRGGFNTLTQCIEFCKQNAEYYTDVEIIHFTYKGEEVSMWLEDAIVSQKRQDRVMKFYK